VGISPFVSFLWEGQGLDTSFLFVLLGFERVGWWIQEKKLKIGRVEGNWQVSPTLQKPIIKHSTHRRAPPHPSPPPKMACIHP